MSGAAVPSQSSKYTQDYCCSPKQCYVREYGVLDYYNCGNEEHVLDFKYKCPESTDK